MSHQSSKMLNQKREQPHDRTLNCYNFCAAMYSKPCNTLKQQQAPAFVPQASRIVSIKHRPIWKRVVHFPP